MTPPAELARRTEQTSQSPISPRRGTEEIRGYSVLGVPFASGHVLTLRRLPATSFGPAYTSVWHRNPAGRWTIFTDAAPELSCPRYFGSAAEQVVQAAIAVEWTDPWHCRVRVPSEDLDWEFGVTATPVTRMMTAMAALMPAALWHSRLVLGVMSAMSTALLGVGRIRMQGHVPNRQWFTMQPRTIFRISESQASLTGEEFGDVAPLPHQAFLADFAMTQRGLLAFGAMLAEAFESSAASASYAAGSLRCDGAGSDAACYLLSQGDWSGHESKIIEDP